MVAVIYAGFFKKGVLFSIKPMLTSWRQRIYYAWWFEKNLQKNCEHFFWKCNDKCTWNRYTKFAHL